MCICTSEEKNLPSILIYFVCICGQGLNSHWPEIYIERSKNTQSRETERKHALLFRQNLPIGARQSHNFFFLCTAAHIPQFVVSTAEEALMGFSFHFSFGEEAYGHQWSVTRCIWVYFCCRQFKSQLLALHLDL